MSNAAGGGGSSFFESTFDYRSLLPTHHRGATTTTTTTTNYADDAAAEDESSLCYEMSLRERLLGCGTCMIAGYMLSMGSFWRLADMVKGDPFPFVVHATVGVSPRLVHKKYSVI